MRRVLLLLACCLAVAGAARAVQPDEVLPDTALEQRARQISGGLRCLVCQNQSIDDSDAPLARDLRILVRERLKAGDSDAAVRDFVVARYGDFVLLRPPFDARTLLLWGAPFLILAGGLAFAWRRRGGRRAENGALSEEEQSRLRRVLDEDGA